MSFPERIDSPGPDRRPAVARLALLFAALFLHNGLQQPFFPLWLAGRGLSGEDIAALLALPLVMRVAATPLAAHIADRRGHAAGVLAVCALFAVAGYGCLFLAFDFVTVALAIAFIASAQGPMGPLIDALSVAEVRASHGGGRAPLSYGRIRVWGSLAFMAGNLGGGLLVGWFGIASVLALLTCAAMVSALTCWEALRFFPGAAPAPEKDTAAAAIPRPGLLAAVIGAAALIQASHALVLTFGTIHWRAEGLPDFFLGFSWMIGVAAEVGLFWMSGQIFSDPRRAAALLALGGGAAVLRWSLMAGDPAPGLLLGLQLLHGITFGATHLGSIGLIGAMTSPAVRARAQGWFSACIALVTALAIAASGPLYARFGESGYHVMTALAALGLSVGLGAALLRGRAAARDTV